VTQVSKLVPEKKPSEKGWINRYSGLSNRVFERNKKRKHKGEKKPNRFDSLLPADPDPPE